VQVRSCNVGQLSRPAALHTKSYFSYVENNTECIRVDSAEKDVALQVAVKRSQIKDLGVSRMRPANDFLQKSG